MTGQAPATGRYMARNVFVIPQGFVGGPEGDFPSRLLPHFAGPKTLSRKSISSLFCSIFSQTAWPDS